jgi:hypothetical protein
MVSEVEPRRVAGFGASGVFGVWTFSPTEKVIVWVCLGILWVCVIVVWVCLFNLWKIIW